MAAEDGDGGRGAALWALGGAFVVFAQAALGLGLQGLATVRAGLRPGEWLALIALTAAFVYGEGVMALERRFVPHLVERARRLRTERRPVMRVLAPFYAFSLVGASRAALLRAWAGVALIAIAVAVVRAFSEPWRGIVDVAVAAALAWAAVALVRQAPAALR